MMNMADTQIRIASYNIRKARGLDQKRNPERTLDVINQLDADIVLLQEADRRLGVRRPALPRDMISAETDFSVLDLSKNGISLGWHGNAILVRGPIRSRSVQHIDLPGTEPRGAVLVDFEVGKGLRIVATHLGLMRRDRRAQLETLRRATAHTECTVIAGDFNEWSRTKGLEPLQDAFTTYAPGRSFHARRPLAALDRFALSHALELRDGGVEEGDLAKLASDHLPVWSDIRVPSDHSTC